MNQACAPQILRPTLNWRELDNRGGSRRSLWVANCKIRRQFWIAQPWFHCAMRDVAVLFLHLLATVARLVGPGGARSVVAESVLVKHQLLILNRSRTRSPSLRFSDRVVAGVCALLIRPRRLIRSAIVLKPATLLRLHRALTTRKYRRLFSSRAPKKPGPEGPSQEVVAAVIEMKRRNPTWGVHGSLSRSSWRLAFP